MSHYLLSISIDESRTCGYNPGGSFILCLDIVHGAIEDELVAAGSVHRHSRLQ
jgi:hypothetical protein